VKAIELSDKTALTPKEKSLISLAVAAQIPCSYCIWSDTENARHAAHRRLDVLEGGVVVIGPGGRGCERHGKRARDGDKRGGTEAGMHG
ncbi:MAG: hypothetical protein E5W02_22345, partial [Mesorhizobium sp.]